MIILWSWISAWLDQIWCAAAGCDKRWIGADTPVLVCRRCTR